MFSSKSVTKLEDLTVEQYPTPTILIPLVGFCRACATERCAHPLFRLSNTQNRALRASPPAHGSFAASLFITICSLRVLQFISYREADPPILRKPHEKFQVRKIH